MIASLMATAMAVAAPVQTPVHEVVPGESLSWIAQCELGDPARWGELLELNRDLVDDPDTIQPGWVLVLPEAGTGACPAEPPVQVSSPAPATVAPKAAARSSRSAGSSGKSAPSKSGAGLAGIRQCESSGDYGAVSSSGKYRGAYQFDQSTWESVGGSGDPAAASPAEQDKRAAALQQQRGSSPWPSCG